MSSEDYSLSHSIVGTLRDGRTIARSMENFVVKGSSIWYCRVAVPNLRVIDAILDINIRSVSPKATVYGICDKTVSYVGKHPCVGFTVGHIPNGITATGTTITPEVVVVGW